MNNIDIVNRVKELRKNNKGEEARELLLQALNHDCNDPELNYQMAWTCDFMGLESEAIPYYKNAIENNLNADDKLGAYLGLGSTYRCIGEYQNSLETFDKGISEFPEYRAFYVFRALTLFNLNKYEKSIEDLLLQLIETTSDNSIKLYTKALKFYSDKLNQTWT